MDEKTKKIITDKNVKLEINNGQTLVHFNGKTQLLSDMPIDISDKIKNIKFCSFCGAPSGDDPLFTIDKKIFICKDCTLLAYNTFMENGVPMPINLKVKKNEKRTS